MNNTNGGSAATASNGNGTTSDDRHAIATYLSDVLALEKHIRQPLAQQTKIDEVGNYADGERIINAIRSLTEAHVTAIDARLNAVGGHGASPVKSAWTQLLGAGAAAVDSVRKTKVSKSLRDDYTALALASISYTMLHATALGLGDQQTADLAKQHLDDYAPIVVEIGKTIPAVVLQELRDDGENVTVSAAEIAERNTSASWK